MSSESQFEPVQLHRYRPRCVISKQPRRVSGRDLKWYEIDAQREGLPSSIVDRAEATVGRLLDDTESYLTDLGFVILHRGLQATWLLVELWEGDILHHHGFRVPVGSAAEFEAVSAGGPTLCVWELEVVDHERRAFIQHMLNGNPEPRSYLADTFGSPVHPFNAEAIAQFASAWSRGDVPAMMSLMSDDPQYFASTGPGPGRRFSGRAEVAEGMAAVVAEESAAPRSEGETDAHGEIWTFGTRAVSFWSRLDSDGDGASAVVRGIDVWEFDGDRIKSKDAYRKAFG